MSGRTMRMVIGSLFGLAAGVSFGLMVLPYIAEWRFSRILPPEFYPAMATYAFPLAILWAPFGAMAAERGGALSGARIMSVGGVVAGIIFAFMVSGARGPLQFLMLSIATGGVYGWGAGFLIGWALPGLKNS